MVTSFPLPSPSPFRPSFLATIIPRSSAKCSLLAGIEEALSNLNANCSNISNIREPISKSTTGQPLPSANLKDERPLPAHFITAAIQETEGADYSW